MSYNDELQSNNEELSEILNTVNELPEAGSGPSVDLTGYATEQWVQEGYQPKGDYALKSDIPAPPVRSVNGKTGAVTLGASDVGALPAGTKIPTKTSDLANDSGFVKGSFMVSLIESDDGLSADKTPMEIASAFIDGRYVYANYGGIQLGLAAANEDVAIFFLNGGNSVGQFTVLPDKTVTMESFMVATEDMIPTKTSDLTNDSGFLTDYTETDPTVPAWAKAASKPSYSKAEVGLGNVDNVKQYSASNPPPYPVTSVNGKTGNVAFDMVNPADYAVSVKALGAKGDASTDDTAVFRSALENNRKVYVPGGTYKLSGELIIGLNCQLELAQDVLLNFTQTSGNCISMKASANIVGNHSAIKVPYEFTGRVINIYAGLDASIVGVPPFSKWGPMWMAARYITDLHIAKLDYRGVAQAVNVGDCCGTAVYLGADYNDSMPFLWAVDLDRLRISGAFSYGIHLDCPKNASSPMSSWIHQTRINGFVDGAEVGVYLKYSTLSYISVMVIPRRALSTDGVYSPYAKHGIVLEDSTDVDLSGSRVMDWNSTYSLWSEGNENQHLALLGNCAGAILNEHYYYEMPNYDIRSLIYTNNPSNLEKLTIMQEPITRWFKPVEGIPYFNDGFTERRLMLREELDDFASLERVPNFTNKVPTAINLNGTILNDTGYYAYGARWNGSDGKLFTNATYYGCTGLIPAKPGDVIRAKNLTYKTGDNYANIVFFNSSKEFIGQVYRDSIISNASHYWSDNYVETEDGFEVQISNKSGGVQSTAYVAFSFNRANIGENPVITVNEPLTYSEVGVLADTIHVKAENLIGLPETYTKTEVDAIMGSYINDVDTLVGGGF